MPLITEKPPTRLVVNITAPDGSTARWGQDDPNAANQHSGLTFTTAMPGGFNDFSCTLARSPRQAWPDLEPLSDIRVSGLGGSLTAFEGRLEQEADEAGSQAQITPTGVGYQAHLDDRAGVAMIYIDQNLSAWGGSPLNRQIALAAASFTNGSASVAVDPSTNQPAIVLEVDGAWASPNIPEAEVWYDSGIAGPIAKVWYSYEPGPGVGGGSWLAYTAVSVDDAGASFQTTANLATGSASSGYLTPSTPERYAVLDHYYTGTPGGTDGQAYLSYWKAAVYGDHGLTGSGPDPVAFLASDVVAHAVGTWAPLLNFTTGAGGSIQPSSFVIPQLAFLDPGTVSVIVKQASQYELLDWYVYDRRTFYLNARGASPVARAWQARIGPAQLQNAGQNVSRVWNGVVATFTMTDGTTMSVGPPGSGAEVTDASLIDTDSQNPANQIPGLERWAPLAISTTTTPTGAIKIASLFLQEQKELDSSGQAALVGHIQDSSGVWWPSWLVRGGDTISFVDARDSSPRRVVSTSYDDASRTNSPQLDQPPDGLDALLERLSAVIQPFGFS